MLHDKLCCYNKKKNLSCYNNIQLSCYNTVFHMTVIFSGYIVALQHEMFHGMVWLILL